MKSQTVNKFKFNDTYFNNHPALGAQALKGMVFEKAEVGFYAESGIAKVTITDNAVEQCILNKEIDIIEGYVSE